MPPPTKDSGAPFRVSPYRVARYVFHDCDRYLRFLAASPKQRRADRLDVKSERPSVLAKALIDRGYDWEDEVIGTHLAGHVRRPAGNGSTRTNHFSWAQTLKELKRLDGKKKGAISQATLQVPARFYDRFGLDPEVVHFGECRPDVLMLDEFDGDVPALRVVDVKASDQMKMGHVAQVALYVLILRDVLEEHGLDLPLDMVRGGVWLYGRDEPEWADVGSAVELMETLLRNRLMDLLQSEASEVAWHVHYRCEWCELFHSCRQEADENDSVSLVPYLTSGGRQFLREAPWDGGEPVETLEQFGELLEREDVAQLLEPCGSLRGWTTRLREMIAALREAREVDPDSLDRSQAVRPFGGSSIAMPQGEHVALHISLQRDPASGNVFAAGFCRAKGKEVYGDGQRIEAFVAESVEDCERVQREFILSLHDELATLHRYNEDRKWNEQRTLQSYVFDSYERTLLERLLVEALDDEELAPIALQLMFVFHNERLSSTRDQPRNTIPFPLVSLVDAVRELVALPVELAYRLQEVLECLPNQRFPYKYFPKRKYTFELSNAMRSDEVLKVWARGDEASVATMVAEVEKEIEKRLRAAGNVVDGLRQAVTDGNGHSPLFAWPPRFAFPDPLDFNHPELAKLHFIVRYESLRRALDMRQARAKPRAERAEAGTAIHLRYRGDDRWRVTSTVQASALEPSTFFNYLLVPDSLAGERAQLTFDDFRFRQFTPNPRGELRFASLYDVDENEQDATATELVLELQEGDEATTFKRGAKAILLRRHTDYTSDRVATRLADLDEEEEHPFLDLLRDPESVAMPMKEPPAVRKAAMAHGKHVGLTPSQLDALKHVLGSRFTLILGPPGTGKTRCLAEIVVALVKGYHQRGRDLRVGVTAFTHAAVENLLGAIEECRDADDEVDDLYVAKLSEPRRDGAAHAVLDWPKGEEAPDTSVLGGTVHDFRKASEGRYGLPISAVDVLIVDEASQMKFGELALATLALGDGTRLVLAGDDLQLAPITAVEWPKPEDGELPGLEASCFEYLRARDTDGEYTVQLTETFRMNATLTQFATTLYGEDYQPANESVAARKLRIEAPRAAANKKKASPKAKKKKARRTTVVSELVEWLLDPHWPLAVAVLEDVRASTANPAEAQLVAALAVALRERLVLESKRRPLAEGAAQDRRFFREGLAIVSPHHAQIRELHAAMRKRREWLARPFIDTVEKMQGQQCEAVLVSYGVSDAETAAAEDTFIYDLNRFNVALTRARSKCVAFLPRPLLQPSFALTQRPDVIRGLAHMQRLISFCHTYGETCERELPSHGRITCYRAFVEPE